MVKARWILVRAVMLVSMGLAAGAVGPPLDLSGEWEAVPNLFVSHGGPYHRLKFQLQSIEALPATVPGFRTYEVRYSGQLTYFETRSFYRAPAGCDLGAVSGPDAYEAHPRTYSLGYGLSVTSYWTIQAQTGADSGKIQVGSIEGVGTFNLPEVPRPHAPFLTRMLFGFHPRTGSEPVGDAHARLLLSGFLQEGGERVESDRCWNTPFGTGVDHGQLSFWRVSAGPAELAPVAKIRGRLKSAVTVLTSGSGDEVHRASVHLFRQSQPLREKEPQESDAHYRAYLEGERTLAAPAAILTPDSQGRFEFQGLPLFARSGGPVRGWVPQQYLLVVASAETDEMALDDESNVIPGRTNTVSFQGAARINLLADTELEIELRPTTSINAKREIVAQIQRLGPKRYGPIEAGADAHLDQLAGRANLTEAEDEGVRRALWAERVVRDGARYADTALDLGLNGLGTLLADAIGDLKRWEGKELSEARKQFQKVRDSAGPAATSGFNVDSVADLTPAMRQLLERGQSGELADEMIKMVKALRPAIYEALLSRGVPRDDAKFIAVGIEQAMLGLVNLAKSRSVAGASKDLVKLAIKEYLDDALKPSLYDSAAPYSFTALTAPSLQYSVDRMIQWDRSDQASYLRDRDRTVETLTELGNSASSVIADTILLQGGAEAADLTQKYAGLARVVPPARAYAAVLEQVAKAAKYLANGAGIIRPAIYAFASAPKLVREGVYAAYGGIPPAGAEPSSPSSPARERPTPELASSVDSTAIRVALPPTQEILTDLTTLDGLVQSNLVASAIKFASGITGSGYGASWKTWQRESGRTELEMRAYTAPASRNEFSSPIPHAVYFRLKTEIMVAKSAYDDALLEWFLGVLNGAYADARDPRSLSATARIRDLGRVLRAVLTSSQASMKTILDEVRLFRLPRPAILVTLLRSESAGAEAYEIKRSPQRFQIQAQVELLGSTNLDGVTIALQFPAEQTTLKVLGETQRTVRFAPDPVSGIPNPITIAWDVEYVGQFLEASVDFEVQVLEKGESPESFEANTAAGTLSISPELRDHDLDGMPDVFEKSYGLQTELNDAQGDLDSDGASNGDEFDLGTRPDRSDSDGDGLEDLEELEPGKDGVISSPLLADSDGDGVSDLLDGAPLDPSTTAGPSGPVRVAWTLDRRHITLTRAEPSALVRVETTGSDHLRWRAEVDDPSLAWVSPLQDGEGPGTSLIVGLPIGFRWPSSGTYTTRARVRNVADPDFDFVEIDVTVMADFASALTAELSADRGSVQLEWLGVTGKRYGVESSNDLKTWVGSLIAPTTLPSGYLRWSEVRADEAAGGQSGRFYRVVASNIGQ